MDVALFSADGESNGLLCMICEVFGTAFELFIGDDFKLTGLELL